MKEDLTQCFQQCSRWQSGEENTYNHVYHYVWGIIWFAKSWQILGNYTPSEYLFTVTMQFNQINLPY